jgi:hypothetical protein
VLKQNFAIGAIACLAVSATPRTQPPPYSIADIQAHLYYQESGAFDTANITADASPTLWNTIIGEGSAKSPSGATLVLVKLNGRWVPRAHAPQLRVTVQLDSGGPVLLDQAVSLDALFTEGPSVWVPFIALGTGCGVTQISAALVDAQGRTQTTLARTIPFHCGE